MPLGRALSVQLAQTSIGAVRRLLSRRATARRVTASQSAERRVAYSPQPLTQEEEPT